MSQGAPGAHRFVLETRDVEVGTAMLRGMYGDHTPRVSGTVENYRLRYAVNGLDGIGVDEIEQPVRT